MKDNFLFMNVETSHLSGNTRTVTADRARNTSTCRMQMTNGSDVRRSSTFSSFMYVRSSIMYVPILTFPILSFLYVCAVCRYANMLLLFEKFLNLVLDM